MVNTKAITLSFTALSDLFLQADRPNMAARFEAAFVEGVNPHGLEDAALEDAKAWIDDHGIVGVTPEELQKEILKRI